MTKTYIFNNNKSNENSINFKIGSANYSEILDDIILNSVVKKNDYLFNYTPKTITLDTAEKDSDFTKAVKFLANYNKYNNKLPKKFIIGKMYLLTDGTPIVFYDDEVQIGFDTYNYSDFDNEFFLSSLKPKTKKIIINIYLSNNSNTSINIAA